MENADVVVIGAGLVGLSVAYHLAAKGCRHVVVLEREAVWASGSSGRSAGGVRLEFSHPSSVQFSHYGLNLISHFEEHFGVSASFHPCGYLFLTSNQERWDIIQQLSLMQRRLGVPVELLSPEEVRQRFRYVHRPALVGGTFCALDGVADPASVAYGFFRRAQELGVAMRFGEPVTGIQVEENGVVGVTTSKSHIATRKVVNAAGPYARDVGSMAGLDIPVMPFRRSIYVTDSFEGLPKEMPMTLDLDTTSYVRREGRAILLGMSDPEEPSSTNLETDRDSLEKLVGKVLEWVPALAGASIRRGWAGLYEVSPDDSAIIGEAKGCPGFYCANGFSGHGFMHAPAAGRVVAELIGGEEPFVDITPFRLERFKERSKTVESFVV